MINKFNPRYDNSMGNNVFLTLTINGDVKVLEHQINMISNTKPEAILRISKKIRDNQLILNYAVTSKSPMDSYISRKELSQRELIMILRSLTGVIMSSGEYMLNRNNYVLDWNYIYFNYVDNEFKLYLLYLPVDNLSDIEVRFKSFVKEFLTEKVKCNQGGNAIIGSLLNILNDDRYSIEFFHSELGKLLGLNSSPGFGKSVGARSKNKLPKPRNLVEQVPDSRPVEPVVINTPSKKAVPINNNDSHSSSEYKSDLAVQPKPKHIRREKTKTKTNAKTNAKTKGGDTMYKKIFFGILVPVLMLVAFAVLAGFLPAGNSTAFFGLLSATGFSTIFILYKLFKKFNAESGSDKGQNVLEGEVGARVEKSKGSRRNRRKTAADGGKAQAAIDNIINKAEVHNLETPGLNLDDLRPRQEAIQQYDERVQSSSSSNSLSEETVLGMEILSDRRMLKSSKASEGDIHLDKSRLVIGRGEGLVDHLITEKSVSRQHAEIQNVNGTVKIKDLNSKFGTYVNSRKIAANEFFELADGDVVKLATVEYKYQII